MILPWKEYNTSHIYIWGVPYPYLWWDIMGRVNWFFGMDITYRLGQTQWFSRVSGSERAAIHTNELTRGFSNNFSAGWHVANREQYVPVPDHQRVYSKTYPTASHSRGIEMLTYQGQGVWYASIIYRLKVNPLRVTKGIISKGRKSEQKRITSLGNYFKKNHPQA
jgi:hypothetical protein